MHFTKYEEYCQFKDTSSNFRNLAKLCSKILNFLEDKIGEGELSKFHDEMKKMFKDLKFDSKFWAPEIYDMNLQSYWVRVANDLSYLIKKYDDKSLHEGIGKIWENTA